MIKKRTLHLVTAALFAIAAPIGLTSAAFADSTTSTSVEDTHWGIVGTDDTAGATGSASTLADTHW